MHVYINICVCGSRCGGERGEVGNNCTIAHSHLCQRKDNFCARVIGPKPKKHKWHNCVNKTTLSWLSCILKWNDCLKVLIAWGKRCRLVWSTFTRNYFVCRKRPRHDPLSRLRCPVCLLSCCPSRKGRHYLKNTCKTV